MRLVFMGTPEYAEIHLQALLTAGHSVVGVFTQPARPSGRGKKLMPSRVKALAEQAGIPVFQPGRIRVQGLEDLRALKPDICVTAAYGQILSEEILAVPLLGTVNVHASLLPRYRGSAPVNWAIIKGETHTGVTTMMTDKGIDTGDILLQSGLAIHPEETAGELTVRLAHAGAELLLETLKRLAAGDCPRVKQDERAMSYYPLLTREAGQINWQDKSRNLVNLIRGTQPWPGAYSASPWGTLKLLSARVEQAPGPVAPGTILAADPKTGLLVKTGDQALRVITLQAPGSRAMSSEDFLRGHPLNLPAMMAADEETS